MLPKVSRDDVVNHNSDASGINGTNKVVRLLSSTAPDTDNNNGGRGILSSKGARRPISTKGAHLTTIPLDATFLSPLPSPSAYHPSTLQSNRPYLPYSASSPTRARQNSHRVQINQRVYDSSPSRWKENKNGYTAEHSNHANRSRAHSHRSAASSAGKIWSAQGGAQTGETATKTMPYLVPKTPKQRVLSSTAPATKLTTSSSELQKSDGKICTKPGELQTLAMHLVGGGMVMTGSGNPGVAINGAVGSGPVSTSLTKDRVQVCRTKEERDKNPDTIRLDKRGVRVFPDIGGGESTTLKLLSLQHNLITRLENVPLLSQLVVLDLYDNRVERICGLQGLPSLRVLLLGKNRIKRIEGLDSLKRLEILDLHGNQLRYVDNLAPLSALRVLNLAGNLLRNIRNFGPYGMTSLTELNLKRNRIKNLDGLQKVPHLRKLLLANNELQSISALAPLRKLMYLNELVVDPNPLIGAVGSEYQSQVLTLFPNLGILDRAPVSEELKQAARLWHKKKLEEEERRKMEEERIRLEMTQTVGPPGSREQVIYQARRRWESLKNFVKSSGPATDTNRSNPKRPAMKSVKKIVTVVTELKSNKQAELFYPPATLDLEEFPDGQEKLDQTESLLGCESQDDYRSRHSINLPSASEKPEPSNNEKSHTAPSPTNFQVVVNRDYDQKSSSDKDAMTNKINTRWADKTEEPTTDEGIRDGGNILAGISSIIVHSSVSSPIIVENEEQEEERHDENHLTDSQCPSSCSARSNSAKVAVVRPLIHRSATVEESPITAQDEMIALSESKEAFVSEAQTLDFANSNALFATRQPKAEGELTVTKDKEDVSTLENVHEKATPEIVSSTEQATAQKNESDQLETTAHVNCAPSQTSLFQVIEDNEDVDVTSHEIEASEPAPIQSESARVKSKLLKHLRSISLDSYPHPFLRPGGQKPGDASTVGGDSSNQSASPMIPSDDDGDEDDDNDNEVIQDYDCDDEDAYSIATSTCTTVTSGSTPRRSSTVMATTNRLLKNGVFRKQTFPRTRSQRIKIRDRAAKLFGSTSDLSPRSVSGTTTSKRVNSGTGIRGGESTNSHMPSTCGRILRRCDSAASLSTSGLTSCSSSNTLGVPTNAIVNGGGSRLANSNGNDTTDNHSAGAGSSPLRKQGMDFLVEIEGKMLNVFGQGGLRHALTAFASNVTCHVATSKFHYISYDSIIPFFGKLRQVYPSLEHFHFRANNLCTLAQLDALSDLQGLTSLFIAKEGNPIVSHEAWAHYASYRLSHWGLQVINGREVCSEYRGGSSPAAQAKAFESLGFLALSCLPQTALTPLAKRLHMLHCFCCCSPSTSSDESNRRLANPHHARLLHSPSQATADHGSNSNFCTAWDDDPVLLDVIGKEALVYCPPTLPPEMLDVTDNNPSSSTIKPIDTLKSAPYNPPSPSHSSNHSPAPASFERRRAETLGNLVDSGVEIVEKMDKLEKTWPTLMTQVIQEMLMDFRFMDSYMKKELKKCQDITLINQQQQQQHHNNHHHHHSHQHGKKVRH